MTTSKLIAIALAALLVFAGGAAAMPGQAPDDPGADPTDEHQPDDPGMDATNETDTDANESDAERNETAAADERDEHATDAPPTELPAEAPGHVTDIHQLILDKLDGALSGHELGDALSGLLGGDPANQADQNPPVTPGAAASQAGNSSDAATADESDDRGSDAVANAGPPAQHPEQAAEPVSGIHDLIRTFLNGDGDGTLGERISGIAG